jgi:uncharacterized protein (TIGR02588 family)
MNKHQSNKKQDTASYIEKNTLEWSVFGCSLLLVLLIIGYLIYQGINQGNSTPTLTITSKSDPTPNDKHRFRLTVNNTGGETAEDVRIEATSIQSDGLQEKSELMIAFVPKGSSREGWIIFSKPPACDTCLRLRITGYKKP